MSDLTPDQPEQERCPTCGGTEYHEDGCEDEMPDLSTAQDAPDSSPSLHQRIEGLIAEFEERDDEPFFGAGIACRLRAVLKGEGA